MAGIVPLRLFEDKSRTFNNVKVLIERGIVPVIILKPILKVVNEFKTPIAVGIIPFKRLE